MNGFDEQNTPDVSDNNTNSQPNQAPETPYTQETQENAAPQQNPYYAQPDPQNPNNQYTYGNPQQGYPVQPPMYVEQKSKMAAGLLGIFLGSLGDRKSVV